MKVRWLDWKMRRKQKSADMLLARVKVIIDFCRVKGHKVGRVEA